LLELLRLPNLMLSTIQVVDDMFVVQIFVVDRFST